MGLLEDQNSSNSTQSTPTGSERTCDKTCDKTVCVEEIVRGGRFIYPANEQSSEPLIHMDCHLIGEGVFISMAEEILSHLRKTSVILNAVLLY
jgi:hypothetical protein